MTKDTRFLFPLFLAAAISLACSSIACGQDAVRILASGDGYSLTSEHVQTGVDVIQFIIGQAIKPSEVRELEARFVIEFKQAPEAYIQKVNTMSQWIRPLYQLTNPMEVGLARQQLFVAFHNATFTMPETQKPLLIQVINRYIKVLAFDPVSKLVLTDRDIEAMLKYTGFVNDLGGRPFVPTPAQRQAFTNELLQRFVTMPLEQKQLLCSASVIWNILEASWNQLSAAQREQVQAQFRVQQQEPSYAVPDSAYRPSPEPKSLAELEVEMQTRSMFNNMFNSIMTESIRQWDEDMMNTIRNMGDRDTYLEIVRNNQ